MSFFSRLEHVFKYSPDEPRDEHGRWTDGGGDGIEGEREKERWVAENPHTTLDSAMAAAATNQELLHRAGSAIAKKLDIKWKNPGVKKNESGRVEQKAATRGFNGITAASCWSGFPTGASVKFRS